MPLVNDGVTVKTLEQFKYCEDTLARLNQIVQTPDNTNVLVTITLPLLGQGIAVRPRIQGAFDNLRIRPCLFVNSKIDEFWIDLALEQRKIYIRVAQREVHTLHLDPEKPL